MGHVGMVSRLHVVTFPVVPGCFAMVFRRVFMMLGRSVVVFSGFVVFSHALLLPVIGVEQAPDMRHLDRVYIARITSR